MAIIETHPFFTCASCGNCGEDHAVRISPGLDGAESSLVCIKCYNTRFRKSCLVPWEIKYD